ncbi:MAG TPA: FHA domain-containing protein [Candidatus Dormibacteraeota bacterium]|nr:FHA domain-containing protein [Candidatus Dormibacteraeota bacterium]
MTELQEAWVRIDSLGITLVLGIAASAGFLRRAGARDPIGDLTPIPLRLIVYEGEQRREMRVLTPATIGRASTCHVQLADGDVSRRHARFEAEEGVLYVRDLESANGTFLNGEAFGGAIELRVGDEIDCGATRLEILEIG